MLENVRRLRERVKIPVLILDEANLRYYTEVAQGGALLIGKEDTLVTQDFELAKTSAVDTVIKAKGRTSDEILKLLKQKKIKRIGVDFNSLSYLWFKKLQSKKIKLVDASKKLAEMRIIKSEREIEKIKRACELADKAMAEISSNIRAGITERQLRNYAYTTLPQAEDVAFSFITASGPNSEYTHVSPSERRIALSDFLIVDIGFRVDGYNSDLTRTFCLSPTSQQRELYDFVLRAQKLAVDSASPGVSCGKLWGKVAAFFKKDDLDRFWKYGLGHGVGLDIHEPPSLFKGSKEKLKNGMVFTIEPGLHIPDFGGVRIEDTFLLDKRMRALTQSDYTLEP